MDIFYEDENDNEAQKNASRKKFNEILLRLFVVKKKENNERYSDNNYDVFKKLSLMPQAQKAIAQQLCDPQSLQEIFPEWS